MTYRKSAASAQNSTFDSLFMADDADLYLWSVQGDQAALRVLMDRHIAMVRRLAKNILADEGEAEDVAQETFLTIWRGAGRWDGQSARFTTWLHRIAINKAIDHRRRMRERTETPEFLVRAAEAAQGGSREDEQTKGLCRAQISGALRGVLGKLPEGQRRAITLFYFEECEVSEIAARLETSEQAVRALLKRGRSTLREQITKQKKICWNDYFGTDG